MFTGVLKSVKYCFKMLKTDEKQVAQKLGLVFWERYGDWYEGSKQTK